MSIKRETKWLTPPRYKLGVLFSNMKKQTKKIDDIYDRVFIVTDQCMWEMNKQNNKSAPHAVGVVDEQTGQLRYIKSGSKIKFVGGDITVSPSQEDYNKQA